MFNPLSIVAPYDTCQVINNCLQSYNTWGANDQQLDLIRDIQYSGNYYWQGLAIPGVSNRNVAANATINGTVVIPPGTYVTSIGVYASLWAARQGPLGSGGFKFKLYDKGTKASIFYGDYALDVTVGSQGDLGSIYNPVPSDTGMNTDIPFGPAYLMSPFIITGPVVLGWEIVNLANDTNLIQMLLSCAVPINSKSIGNVTVSKKR
jgi:hypothetical protein